MNSRTYADICHNYNYATLHFQSRSGHGGSPPHGPGLRKLLPSPVSPSTFHIDASRRGVVTVLELQEALAEEVSGLEELARTAQKIDGLSYVSGYDQGRLDGILWVLDMIQSGVGD